MADEATVAAALLAELDRMRADVAALSRATWQTHVAVEGLGNAVRTGDIEAEDVQRLGEALASLTAAYHHVMERARLATAIALLVDAPNRSAPPRS